MEILSREYGLLVLALISELSPESTGMNSVTEALDDLLPPSDITGDADTTLKNSSYGTN